LKIFLTSCFVIICCQICKAQFYFEPLIGYQIDQSYNGRDGKFNQFNSAISFIWQCDDKYGVGIQIQRTFPRQYHSIDSSFTANPAFPIYAPAYKTITVKFYSVSIAQHIYIFGWKNQSRINLIVNEGIMNVSMNVSYNYDKTNYTILNPDRTEIMNAAYFTPGVEYVRQLKYGKFFGQVSVTTVTNAKTGYPNSFKYYKPISLNIGYSIPIISNHYEKK
jgi:hypothetical protein